MAENELKSCPFCGGEATPESEPRFVPTFYDPDGSNAEIEYWIRCTKCGAETRLFKTEHEALEAWNKRNEEKNALKSVSGICRGKRIGGKDKKWYVGEVITIDGDVFLIDSYPQKAVNADRRSEGVLSAKYIQLDPDTIQRFANKDDVHGNKLFEGDIIKSTISRTVRMEICYGRYGAFCPNDQEYMENIGFFVVSNTTGDAMPLGPTEEYAEWIGNRIDNPDMKLL